MTQTSSAARTGPTRRRFLAGCGWWAAAAASGGLLGCSGEAPPTVSEVRDALIQALRGVPAPPLPPAQALPADAAASVVLSGLSGNPRRALADPTPLRDHLARQIRQDLEGGRTRFVDGWLLAETEVAVASLVAGRPAA